MNAFEISIRVAKNIRFFFLNLFESIQLIEHAAGVPVVFRLVLYRVISRNLLYIENQKQQQQKQKQNNGFTRFQNEKSEIQAETETRKNCQKK